MPVNPEVRPTDTLANERTFLAYVRTALSFIAFGFVIARFSLFAREMSAMANVHVSARFSSTIFGTAMALSGVIVGLYGSWRYIEADGALRAGGNAPMPPRAAIWGGIIIALIGAVVAADLFSFR